MKKSVLVIFFVCISLVLYACKGKEKTTVYSSKEGKVEVKESGGETKEMKITTKEGTATFKAGKEVPEDIKKYLYPGASEKEGSSWSFESNKENAGGITSTYLNTEDSIDKVIDYYKRNLQNPEYYEMVTPNGRMASFTLKGGQKGGITIVLNEVPGGKGTEIHITKVAE